MKTYATMYNQEGAYTSNCRTVKTSSKKEAAKKLGVKTSQVYLY